MMGRKTIAEYVSDASILASLREIGVDFAQGFCIGKPRPLV
jgi:EAL domain-containing protein (putative c-di-GMP-specific phosphodiesterase class I)